MTPLQHHLTQRPEMPRPFVPHSAAAIAWQRAFQAWVTDKAALVRAEECTITTPAHDHNLPSCSTKADYLWRDLRGRRTA